MKPQTAFADAFARAGLNTAEARLRQAALDALRKHHRNIAHALPTFEGSIEGEPELIRELALFYLCHVDHEMLGAGQAAHVDHIDRAGARQPNGDGRSADPDRAPISAQNLSLTIYRNRIGMFAPEPSDAQRRAAGRVAKNITESVFETFKVRDGRGIGFVRWGELKSLQDADAVSARVIAQLLAYAQADHDAVVRDVIKAADLQAIIAKARENANAL